MPQQTVSIIICTRNRLESLLACLQSLSTQTFQITQLIIVDSSDQPLDIQQDFIDFFTSIKFPASELIYLHTKPGLTFQRNQGILQANADVVFFFDDDVVLAHDYIELLMETFQENLEYGGGMGTIADSRSILNRPSDYLRHFFLLGRSVDTGRLQKSGLPAHPHGKSMFMDIEILSGGLTAYRINVLKKFKFDELVTGYSYMEDVDFSYRVSRQYKLFYDPQAIVEHNHDPLARDQIATNRKMYLVNHNYFFFKNIYPDCHPCIVHYLWSVLGLFVQAILGRHWHALQGYSHGIHEIISNQIRDHHAL